MSLENVRLQLADAEVAEVLADPAMDVRAVQAQVAEVAEVFGGSVDNVHNNDVHRLHRSCRGCDQTYALASSSESITSNVHAEVAEVSYSFTRAQAHARVRAREEKRGKEPMQPAQPLHVPDEVVILRHCRCIDCRNFSRVGDEYFCSEDIGGTKVRLIDGQRLCNPPPDAWHYCACYRGPQISKDVWVWRRSPACRSLGVGRSRHVGAGLNISAKAEQGCGPEPTRRDGASCQGGQGVGRSLRERSLPTKLTPLVSLARRSFGRCSTVNCSTMAGRPDEVLT